MARKLPIILEATVESDTHCSMGCAFLYNNFGSGGYKCTLPGLWGGESQALTQDRASELTYRIEVCKVVAKVRRRAGNLR